MDSAGACGSSETGHEMREQLVEFGFILLLPLLVVAGGLASLFAVGALFNFLDNPGVFTERIEAAFRRPPKRPKLTGADHYYRPYWLGGAKRDSSSSSASRGAGAA
jgi:hypothetical protein